MVNKILNRYCYTTEKAGLISKMDENINYLNFRVRFNNPAQVLLEHGLIELPEMFLDDGVLLKLALLPLQRGLEVGKRALLRSQCDGFHGIDVGPGILERQLPAHDAQYLIGGVEHDFGHKHVLEALDCQFVVDGVVSLECLVEVGEGSFEIFLLRGVKDSSL